ncbi:MAG: hypothetical protein FJ290_33060, partial [Planctomycetes bacterium]|nr:hypothetical protein [Planctomycetota bacterium]
MARRYALLAAIVLPGLAALALLVPGGAAPEARAYSNCAEPDFMTGGPHRTINELALQHFFKTLPTGDVRAAHAEPSDCTLRGPMVVGRSDIVQLVEETRAATWKEWVIQGGFSADEPEIYNSFRHFYDPLSLNPNPRYPLSSQGVPYLTDHLEQINTYLKPSLGTYLKPKFAALAWAANIAARWYADVQVDARDWAINGSKGTGYWENAYCWKKGVEHFQAAFAGQEDGKALSAAERDARFAQAWRALGETMHLLADMCCPPHVRNDSHPGKSLGAMMYDAVGISPGAESHDPNVGILKNDPYELWCQEELVRQCGQEAAPPNVETTLRNARSPMDLFHTVATFTNRNFFSADTIPFHVVGSPNLWVANGCKPYPLPELRALKPEKGYYIASIWGRDVKLCHKSWLSNAGWGGEVHARRITYPCVQDQAAILIPLAKSALARLVDWFVPKLELVADGYDSATKKLTLNLKHTPYGAFTGELLYSDPQPSCRLSLDGSKQASGLYTASASGGRLAFDLSRLPVKAGTTAAVELDLGGLRLRSPEIRLDAPPVLPPQPVHFTAFRTLASPIGASTQNCQDYTLRVFRGKDLLATLVSEAASGTGGLVSAELP